VIRSSGKPQRRRAIAITAVGVILLAGCSSSSDEATEVGGVDFGHVHTLVRDEDGTLLAATHNGLFELDERGADLVSQDGSHDLMALASLPDGTLIASGHPDLRTDELLVDGAPALLGLVRSVDGGRTWESLSLLGEADFHAFALTDDEIVGADGATGSVMASPDGRSWSTRGAVEARDLAMDPGDPAMLLAVAFDGSVQFSDDGGMTWTPREGPELVSIEWVADDLILAVGPGGTVYSAAGPEASWQETGRLPGTPEALLAEGGTAWAALEGGQVMESPDLGETWSVLVDASDD